MSVTKTYHNIVKRENKTIRFIRFHGISYTLKKTFLESVVQKILLKIRINISKFLPML